LPKPPSCCWTLVSRLPRHGLLPLRLRTVKRASASSIRLESWRRNWASARSKTPHYGFEIKSEKRPRTTCRLRRRVRAI
jgi:hypothetical protein